MRLIVKMTSAEKAIIKTLFGPERCMSANIRAALLAPVARGIPETTRKVLTSLLHIETLLLECCQLRGNGSDRLLLLTKAERISAQLKMTFK